MAAAAAAAVIVVVAAAVVIADVSFHEFPDSVHWREDRCGNRTFHLRRSPHPTQITKFLLTISALKYENTIYILAVK